MLINSIPFFHRCTAGRPQRRRFHRRNVWHRCQMVHATTAGKTNSNSKIGSRTQSHHTDWSELFEGKHWAATMLLAVNDIEKNEFQPIFYCSHCQRHRHRQRLRRHQNARYRHDQLAQPSTEQRKNCSAIERSVGIYFVVRKVSANCSKHWIQLHKLFYAVIIIIYIVREKIENLSNKIILNM